MTIEIKVPDIGDFQDVPVIEVLVQPGDVVTKDQGLLTLESDKATLEVPAPAAGTIREIKVKVGDSLSEGDVVAVLDAGDEAGDEAGGKSQANAGNGGGKAAPAKAGASDDNNDGNNDDQPADDGGKPAPAAAGSSGRKADIECRLLVLGGGPGGYTAAFRAADLGVDTVLVERYDTLGGVCLNVGCIPSKALLHAAKVIDEAGHAADLGISFGKPKIELDALRSNKDKVVGQLTKGLAGMAKQRKVRTVTGVGRFISANELEVEGAEDTQLLRFEHAIIAVGSQAVKLPGLPWDDPRLMDSTDALELADVPKRLLVIGGGIIGLEMACVYDALGSEVTVVELADQLIPGADADLVRPLAQRIGKRYGGGIHLKTKVTGIEAQKKGLKASFEGDKAPDAQLYDRILVAVGRRPNGDSIGADQAGVQVTERGFIPVDRQMRTNVPHIFAIGDVVGQPMLAHKATHEGKLAAEVVAGEKREWVARVIPSVAYTDPEIAWVGVTEAEARARGLQVGVGKFPWAASGRAIGIGRTEGFTKLLFDAASNRVIGAGIVGANAGELIAEAALAIEMGAEAGDIALTIHPHPTLSESVAMAAEAYEGTITDLYLPKKK
ncbi:MAG: dihydrolipoyl dehydrogenase [Xanthomonadales bacterium]|nr:dihydrolipoyl dehydrogenase [Xanthomonadales bacterium]